MVDLGFLLITFFILTTALSEPTIAKLIMPKDTPIKTQVKENASLTLMLKRLDSIDYYEGDTPNQELIKHGSFSNLRSVIQQKQHKVAQVLGIVKKLSSLFVLVMNLLIEILLTRSMKSRSMMYSIIL